MALWSVNRTCARALGSRIPSPLSYPFSSRVADRHRQGLNEERRRGDSDVNVGDVVSDKIRKSLDDDDGRDYAEGDGRRRSDGDGNVTGFVAEKAKKGARSAAEMAFNAGETVAGTMESSWGAVKETSEKIKDAVLGDEHERDKNDHRNDKSADDHLRRNPGDSKWRRT